MREYQLYINGSFQPAVDGRTFTSINPFNRETVAQCSLAGPADVHDALQSARTAFDKGPWPRMSREERSALLKKVSDGINARAKELEILEVEDSGSTIRKATEDIFLSARAMNYFSKLAAIDPTQNVEGLTRAGVSNNILVHEPIGVVVAITPWNFPLKMAVWKLGPALAAGNTVVLKPSEVTPVTAMELAKIFDEAGFPPGVVNIIPGYGHEIGDLLTGSPLVDKISFTGSTAVGRHVMSQASATLKKCTLECGGKSANIVLDDADLSIAVDGALYAIFYHQGQCCEAGTRLFVQAGIYDQFMEQLLAKARLMKAGDPKDSSTDIGPLVSDTQQRRVLGYIASGLEQGATLALGGTAPTAGEIAKGFFVEPTIFTNVTNSMRIAQEEIFGPVLSVLKFTDPADAISQANDTIYGLGGAVWSRDAEKALSIARQLRAGTVWINEYHLISEKAPFGGYKQSGIGREFGMDGLMEYMETKHVHIDEVGTREKKFWYNTVVPTK